MDHPICPQCRRSSCHEHATEFRDPIALYYDDCRKKLDAARDALRAAETRGAGFNELRRLRANVEFAANTGD